MAQNVGKVFEASFKSSCPSDMFIYRIPDVKYGNKSICDYLLYTKPYLYTLELKTTKEKTFPFKNIAEHQLVNMVNFGELDGIIAGFVINFRQQEETYFVRGSEIQALVDKGEKRVSCETLAKIGTRIPQEKKRVRFKYDFDVFRGGV